MVSILLLLFIIISALVMTNNAKWYDDIIKNFISLKSENIKIFKIITEFGDWIILIAIVILSLILLKNKKYSMYITINLILSSSLVSIIKLVFKRERPEGMLVNETSYSYPSGHTFISLAFYGFIIYLIITSNMNKKLKYITSLLFTILIILIATSRIYLNAHYPTDVLGALLLSGIYLIVYIKIIETLEGGKNEEKK